jgi:hypothetical protein
LDESKTEIPNTIGHISYTKSSERGAIVCQLFPAIRPRSVLPDLSGIAPRYDITESIMRETNAMVTPWKRRGGKLFPYLGST